MVKDPDRFTETETLQSLRVCVCVCEHLGLSAAMAKLVECVPNFSEGRDKAVKSNDNSVLDDICFKCNI